MFGLRPLGKMLRGTASPTQIILAAALGGLIGFVPTGAGAAGLLVAWVVLLLVLDASLGLALVVAGLAHLVSLLVMPVSFDVGRFLLEGPTEGLFVFLVNAPVTALLGLESYVVSGGIVLGLAFGLLLGGLAVRSLARFRRSMSGLEENSERYKKLTGNVFSRLLMWLVVGGRHGKKTYAELTDASSRRFIRPMGVILVVLVGAAVYLVPSLVSGPWLAGVAKGGLASWNGATVDLASVELDVAGGRLVLDGLAMADPNDLQSDLFSATRVEADLAGADLLRKRVAIERIVVTDGRSGAARQVPGVQVGPAPSPSSEAPPADDDEDRSLDDILADAEVWEDRLAQVREWLERLGGEEQAEPEDGESWEERLEREVAAKGWAGVVAEHLRTDAPSLVIDEIVADGMIARALGSEVLDLRLLNISTNPGLVEGTPRLVLKSREGTLDVELALGGPDRPALDNVLRFALKGVSTEAVAGSLKVDGEPLVSGGTFDLVLDGNWKNGHIGKLDLPMTITLHGATLALAGANRSFDELALPFTVRGSLDAPRIRFEDDALEDALKDQLRGELEDRARSELEGVLGDNLPDDLGGADLSGGLGGLMDGYNEKKAQEEAEDEAKKAAKKARKKAKKAAAAEEDGGGK